MVALLGPNGAGKTTCVRMLATLLSLDGGRARVGGYDVEREAARLRSVIGLNGQYAALDPNLTGRENIVMVGELYQLPRRMGKERAADLLDRFRAHVRRRPSGQDLLGRDDPAGSTFAASIVSRPRILYLDEPTTGLDPRSRRGMWEVIRELVDEGATLLLTTQYLEEELTASAPRVTAGLKTDRR